MTVPFRSVYHFPLHRVTYLRCCPDLRYAHRSRTSVTCYVLLRLHHSPYVRVSVTHVPPLFICSRSRSRTPSFAHYLRLVRYLFGATTPRRYLRSYVTFVTPVFAFPYLYCCLPFSFPVPHPTPAYVTFLHRSRFPLFTITPFVLYVLLLIPGLFYLRLPLLHTLPIWLQRSDCGAFRFILRLPTTRLLLHHLHITLDLLPVHLGYDLPLLARDLFVMPTSHRVATTHAFSAFPYRWLALTVPTRVESVAYYTDLTFTGVYRDTPFTVRVLRSPLPFILRSFGLRSFTTGCSLHVRVLFTFCYYVWL